jgi:hypothetical protein
MRGGESLREGGEGTEKMVKIYKDGTRSKRW